MKKLIAGLGMGLMPFAGLVSQAHAAAAFEVPTSTVSSFTATITDTLSDPGLLAVLVIAAALPVIFWVIHRVKALFPRSGR